MPINVSSTWQTARPVARNKLIDRVCQLYGLQGDDEARDLAQDMLDEVCKRINTKLFEFNVVTETGLAITANSAEVQLAGGGLFYKEKAAYLVRTSDSKPYCNLDYIGWSDYLAMFNQPSLSTGLPTHYSTRNIQLEGKVYLGLTPGSSEASTYTLTVEYYRRIPLVSETEQLLIPQEVEVVLLDGARALFADHIQGGDSQEAMKFEGRAGMALDDLRQIDKHHPDERPRFRLPWDRARYNPTPRPFYIRID